MLCLLLAGLCALPGRAEVVVIANVHNGVDRVTSDEAVNIFMGRYRKFAHGAAAVPVDLEADSPVRRLFYRRLLDKSLEEINSYWVRLIFSGGTQPPHEVRGPEEMIERIATDLRAIGYVDRSHLTRSEHPAFIRDIKVVLTLPE